MNKVVPFIFPTVALLIVLFLAFRWVRMSSVPQGEIAANGENVVIETLSNQERDSILRGTGDFKTQPLTGEGETAGTIRYEVHNERVVFSINADLPKPATGFYQVWVKSGTRQTKAFRLVESKAGYMGSAAFAQEELPVEIIVSLETEDDATLEKTILSGSVNE